MNLLKTKKKTMLY